MRIKEGKLIRVRGIARFWKEEESKLLKHTESLSTALYLRGTPLIFLLAGDGEENLIIFDGGEPMRKALISSFPGLRMETLEDTSFLERLFEDLSFRGFIIGVPSAKPGSQGLERLIRGMRGERWAYLVEAKPIGEERIKEGIERIAAEIWRVKTQLLSKGTADQENRSAQRQVELLEENLKRFEIGLNLGMWNVRVQIFAQDDRRLEAALSILKGTISAENSPQPITPTRDADSNTILNSKELSILIQPPKEENQGYEVREYVRFDSSVNKAVRDGYISLGSVLVDGEPSHTTYRIKPEELVKHTMVVGMTGSGKTNSCLHLLLQIWREFGIPFLVIEPAKTEYRNLALEEGFESLQIFTLGDERIAPFRLNPFEFQDGVPVQSHIDHLRSTFNASFPLYPPMPYVLEQALHEIYQDKGWDLAGSYNARGGSPLSYPTLADLYTKVDEITERMGWHERMRMDVQASLRARIGSLMVGGKGLMLEGRGSIPIEEILEKPTILELQQIGDDEEKAFLIGLIMTRIYEYYRAKASKGEIDGSLKHITLIEEAHRLLREVPTEKISPDLSNIKGKAVETFCNMLSEIRAYGEGIIIVEQIPTKLSSDAIKNTNLKILHRIADGEERERMGKAMNMNEEQISFISTLKRGEAAVYCEGEDRPILIKVPLIKLNGKLTDLDLASRRGNLIHPHFHGCERCVARGDCHSIKGKEISKGERFKKEMDRFILTCLLSDEIGEGISGIIRSISENHPFKAHENGIIYCSILHGIESSLDMRGKMYWWEYDKMAELQIMLEMIAERALQNSDVRELLRELRNIYRDMCYLVQGPYPACSLCRDVCLFRYDANQLLKERRVQMNFSSLFEGKGSKEEKLERAAIYCILSARKAIHSKEINCLKRIGLCLAAQISYRREFEVEDQMRLCEMVIETEIRI